MSNKTLANEARSSKNKQIAHRRGQLKANEHKKCTHDIEIDYVNRKVTKTSDISNPNYNGFLLEQEVHYLLGTGIVSKDSIVMDYFGNSGFFCLSHVSSIDKELNKLSEKLSDVDSLKDKVPVVGDASFVNKVDARVDREDYFSKLFFANATSFSGERREDFVITHTDLKPDNYAVDDLGNVRLFDFESVAYAPKSYAWSSLLLNLLLTENVYWRDFANLGLWDESSLRFKAAMHLTHFAWRNGEKEAFVQKEKIDNILSLLDTSFSLHTS